MPESLRDRESESLSTMDSERSYGIMKKRFRILQIQSYLHTATSIDIVFKVMPCSYEIATHVDVDNCVVVACF